MSTLGTYSFLPWLRQGLATRIDTSSGARASIKITVEAVGDKLEGGEKVEPVERTIALYGPGDIVGVEQRNIVRTDPLPQIANFEPNYLPFVEFYNEDFAWRYTPLKADASRRLTPWITLVVLTEQEFKNVPLGSGPLPSIDVSDPTLLPPASDLWAWAHVHVQKEIKAGAPIVDADEPSVSEALRVAIGTNPDDACARLMSPRRLAPNTGYHAFIVPTFESGRLAGLGLDPAKSPSAGHIAWTDHAERSALSPTLYPYYHRWSFRTGASGDFEYLVRLLKPRPVDSRVGVRDLDVQRPGASVSGITTPPVLKFSGALRAPRETMEDAERQILEAQDRWAEPAPHLFQTSLASLINLSDGYEHATAKDANRDYADTARAAETDSAGAAPAPPALGLIDNDPDPIITPHLYARWHTRTHRLLTLRDGSAAPHSDNWVHELNLDPRWRSAAGLGLAVIQTGQEDWMASAWAQVGALPDANRRIRQAQVALEISHTWLLKSAIGSYSADPARALMFTAPTHLRVTQNGKTVRARAAASITPPALTSAAVRRAIRPRARLSRKLGFTPDQPAHAAIERVDAGIIPATPPKTAPPSLPKIDDVASSAQPRPWPPFLEFLARVFGRRAFVLIALIFLVAIIGAIFLGPVTGAIFLGIAGALAAGLAYLRAHAGVRARAADLTEAGRTPESVDRIPSNARFTLTETAEEPPTARSGGGDSADAKRLKEALRAAYSDEIETGKQAPIAPTEPLDLARTAMRLAEAVNPRKTLPRRTLHGLKIPPRFTAPTAETFDEIMNYPVFDTPMYKPLKDISSEYLIPNLHLIPPDTVTLLETNQKFVESYMVGLNDEFSRELLWREYPTDQRGSSFRQFWDATAYYDPAAADPEALRESLRDIPQIHRWGIETKLGQHDNREEPGAPQEEEVVLAIRGELLKKYPNAVIYAHKAKWAVSEGRFDPSQERDLVELTPAEEEKPPRDKVKTPLYQAQASDDIFLFGFDLTVEAARGGSGEDPSDAERPGWFFVIKERPGEPRFGLDEGDGSSTPQIWSDVSWGHAAPGAPAGAHLTLANAIALQEPPSSGNQEVLNRHAQWEEDRQVGWGPTADSAQLAYVLYQTPMLVAVHAAELLNKPVGPP